MKLRQMVFTCEPVTAAQLYEWGTVYKLTEPDDLLPAAIETAEKICRQAAAPSCVPRRRP